MRFRLTTPRNDGRHLSEVRRRPPALAHTHDHSTARHRQDHHHPYGVTTVTFGFNHDGRRGRARPSSEMMPLSTWLGAILPGQRMMSGARKPPSEPRPFSPRNGEVPSWPSGPCSFTGKSEVRPTSAMIRMKSDHQAMTSKARAIALRHRCRGQIFRWLRGEEVEPEPLG